MPDSFTCFPLPNRATGISRRGHHCARCASVVPPSSLPSCLRAFVVNHPGLVVNHPGREPGGVLNAPLSIRGNPYTRRPLLLDGTFVPILSPEPRRQTRRSDHDRANLAEKDRPRLQRRPRHQRHPPLAQGALPRREARRLRRRTGAGRRAQGHRRQGLQERRGRSGRDGPAAGVRREVLLPDAAGPRDLRAGLPARHQHRPAADRRQAGGGRPPDRRRRRRPRRHRQGQRPGPLRADLHGPRPRT